jgi:hypothetical protein
MERRGRLDTPVVGRFRDDVGRFECDDLLGGREAKVRFDWKDITHSSARWEQSLSFDDGRTFDTNWIMEFTVGSDLTSGTRVDSCRRPEPARP